MRQAVKRAAIACAAAFVLALCAAPGAHAFIYFPSSAADAILRANVDGTGAQGFISTPGKACGVAVDRGHIYWTNINLQGSNLAGTGTIGRANLDGSAPDPNFITGASNPCGVAVDGSHIYWANNVSSGSGGSIGRANIDGSSPNQSIVSPINFACGVAVDGSHLYWGDRELGTTPNVGSIGRSNLDGGAPEPNFIPGATHPCGVAVDGAHVQWANFSGGTTIGRSNLDGSAPDQNFITGAFHPCGVAVDGSNIFWANSGSTPSIGRANLDGTGVNQSLIAGMNSCWVAVDLPPLPPPPVVPITPRITFLRLSPSPFVGASSGPSATATRRRRPVVRPGTKVSYTLNIASSVRFAVQQLLPGRSVRIRRRSRCVAPTRGNRRAPRCTRVVMRAGSFSQSGRAGANSFRFTGRLRGRKLAPGSYVLVATPSANGRTGSPATVRFRVKP